MRADAGQGRCELHQAIAQECSQAHAPKSLTVARLLHPFGHLQIPFREKAVSALFFKKAPMVMICNSYTL